MTVGQQAGTTIKCLIGFDSLLLLGIKALTPIFTVVYYYLMEDYVASDLTFAGFPMFFLELVIFWHFFSRLIRACFEVVRSDQGPPIVLIILTGIAFIAKLVWVIWFTAAIERQYGFTKHLFIGLYIFFQLVSGTNLGEMSQDFWYFIADAIILS